MTAKTLYDKLWDMHTVTVKDDGTTIIYIDRHLIHEVTSAQAFEGIKLAGRKLWRPKSIIATPDHQVPTENQHLGNDGIDDVMARIQVVTLDNNCDEWGITEFKITDKEQGIVHVVGPEQGFSLPGMTIVCGDSHTSTHGALAALAQGIGSSEVEHVMATQCLQQKKSTNLRVNVEGELSLGVTAKDLILYVIGKLGTSGGNGCVIEYTGSAIRALSMEARFTVCNMSIEAGARAGLVAYDDITEAYVKGRPHAPKGEDWEKASKFWRENLQSDAGAHFDRVLEINAADIEPQVTWGTKPEMTVSVNDVIPNPADEKDPVKRADMESGLRYMDLQHGQKMSEIKLDQVFIGSCTNSRIEDLRAVATVVKGRKVSPTIKRAMIVPGSGLIKEQAEQEGLDKIFLDAGFQWRQAGCSMCNAMNPDQLGAGEHCASTSNRNFEGRQGYKGRTHLVSPAMAAAAAIAGHFVDVREFVKH
jgi:3-isopropylmalate/(R)-2-methylmalate dehydratase large subunit